MLKNIVVIKIDGKKYQTIIVKGVQRFPTNKLYEYLWTTGQVNLNRLADDYYRGNFTKEEYMEFHRGLGTSVGSFQEIFENAEIENPLWVERSDKK